jgi:hypothetical protein
MDEIIVVSNGKAVDAARMPNCSRPTACTASFGTTSFISRIMHQRMTTMMTMTKIDLNSGHSGQAA